MVTAAVTAVQRPHAWSRRFHRPHAWAKVLTHFPSRKYTYAIGKKVLRLATAMDPDLSESDEETAEPVGVKLGETVDWARDFAMNKRKFEAAAKNLESGLASSDSPSTKLPKSVPAASVPAPAGQSGLSRKGKCLYVPGIFVAIDYSSDLGQSGGS